MNTHAMLANLAAHARGWEPDARLLGNLRAEDIAAACEAALAAVTSGGVCSHGHAVLVTHVDDGEPCADYLRAAPHPHEKQQEQP